MKPIIATVALLLCTQFGLFAQKITATESRELVDYALPLVGTDSRPEFSNGNTYPAIALPWGMNFWSPQTGKMGDGWMYSFGAEKIRGFKQTHQPSPWMNDYGQFSIMPMTGTPVFDQDERASWFSHKAETAEPNYYQVYLADHNINLELTPTERAALFRITYPAGEEASLILDAFDNGSEVTIDPENKRITGYSTKNSGGVPDNFKNYFVLEFDENFTLAQTVADSLVSGKLTVNANHVGALIGFGKKSAAFQVKVKVASSFVSPEQALLNLEELGSGDFETLRSKGRDAWNEQLGKIEVGGGSIAQLEMFYTSLYRSLLFPRKFYEINADGEVVHYSPYNGKVESGYMYTDTGFWDTFRALFPLLNLVYPDINAEIQAGLANAYKEGGWLPEWGSPGLRNVMVGNNSASVVADAYLKIGEEYDYDIETLYEALIHGANNEGPLTAVGRAGVEYYNKLGYVPYDVKINENAARTLEYSYDDFTIYQLAKKLNKPQSEIDLYKSRAMNYKKLFDKESGWMRGKNEDGSFQSPFNPLKWGDAFTEGNSMHYTWSVFQDIQGLVDLMGGEKAFVDKLDGIFTSAPTFEESYYGFVIHEIREMQVAQMGQYAHGNQPIQHMIYLYNHALQPWKAQHWVRETMDRMYRPTPDGYCGDEDNGQTSAWYVFSALGFYPVTPGADEYVLGAPLFKEAKIHLANDNAIEISAPNNSPDHRYIKSMTWDGKSYDKTYLNYFELKKGAKLNFEMDTEPNKSRGISASDKPFSLSLRD
ncbi:putative alpha-1,2-mannosidase [Algoriphagus sp. 4150]|uniref:GH92 family glycosyl hydrolase n=1 Tax=Algoriphagus sp. 4150 TaxID=2817756 RepID=UPI00285706D8|nr:GH92 family glycosyl hydrolase [Algoriphagus sp. 4150]MDR7131086.1 putative alpha-1,2-mannosidase [Algoriphagus sp. 4150]